MNWAELLRWKLLAFEARSAYEFADLYRGMGGHDAHAIHFQKRAAALSKQARDLRAG